MRRALVAFAILFAACGKHDRAAPAPGPTDACAAFHARFDDALAHAPGTCATDADCDCYPGGLGASPSCGGITDRKTAAALHAIADDFARASCRMTIQCSASVCAPRCERGRCR
jgi:hypothetical protein